MEFPSKSITLKHRNVLDAHKTSPVHNRYQSCIESHCDASSLTLTATESDVVCTDFIFISIVKWWLWCKICMETANFATNWEDFCVLFMFCLNSMFIALNPTKTDKQACSCKTIVNRNIHRQQRISIDWFKFEIQKFDLDFNRFYFFFILLLQHLFDERRSNHASTSKIIMICFHVPSTQFNRY